MHCHQIWIYCCFNKSCGITERNVESFAFYVVRGIWPEKRKRDREKTKRNWNRKEKSTGYIVLFTEIMWGYRIDVLMVLKTHLVLKKTKQEKGFFVSLWFLTRSRLVLSSCCPVYLEATNNSNCNCIICEGLGYKEYECRTENYAGMITWLIPWLVANDRFYLIKRRAIRLNEMGQTYQSSGYASLVWRRAQDALCIQTNFLSSCVVQDVWIYCEHGQLHLWETKK